MGRLKATKEQKAIKLGAYKSWMRPSIFGSDSKRKKHSS